MSFQDGLDKIVNVISDLSELNVRTFTGTVTTSAADQTLKELMDAALTGGDLEVVAYTTMKIDGDVDQYISNSKDVSDSLREAHASAVDSGEKSRKATMALFTKAIREAIDKAAG